MGSISGRVVGLMRDGASRLALDWRAAERGLSFEGQVTDAQEWLPWNEMVRFAERLTAGMSGAEVEELGMAIARSNTLLHLAYRAFPSPRSTLRVFWSASEAISDVLAWSAQPHGDHLRLAIELQEGPLPSEPFFRTLMGQLRASPELSGGPPPAEPRVLALDGRGLWVDIFAPPSAIDRALESGQRQLDRMGAEFLSMARARFRPGGNTLPDVPTIQRSLGLTETQARIARQLADGSDLPAIADQLGVSLSTVRTHLRSIYTRTGANSQARLVSRVLLRGD